MKRNIAKGIAAFTALLLLFGGLFFYVADRTGGPALGATIPTPVALFETTLANSISSSATSMTLTSGTDKDGTTFAGETYGFVIDEGTSKEEFVIATCTGTSCTSMTRGVSVRTGNTSVTALKKSHRRGASVKITDAPVLLVLSRIVNGDETIPNVLSYASGVTPIANDDLTDKEYVDGVAVAGAPDANTTTKGIFEQATVAELNSGNATGTTGAILAFSPADIAASIYGTRLPTVDEQAAMDGTSGTPSASNKYVTSEDVADDGTASKIARLDANSQLTIAETPTADAHAASKVYVENQVATAADVNFVGGVGRATDVKSYWNFQLPFIVSTDVPSTNFWSEQNTNSNKEYYMSGVHWAAGSDAANSLITTQPIFIADDVENGAGEGIKFDETRKIIVEHGMQLHATGSEQMAWGLSSNTNPFSDYDDASVDSATFSVDGSGNLYAHSSPGGGGGNHTETAISGITLTDMNTYRIEFDPGVDVKFYVNGTLEATHTTNIPNSAVIRWGFGASGNTANNDFMNVTAPWFAVEK